MLDTEIKAQKQILAALNQSCFCTTLDRGMLCRALDSAADDPEFCKMHVKGRPHSCPSAAVFRPATESAAMQKIVTAIHAVSPTPA
jgi:hypothetical protein